MFIRFVILLPVALIICLWTCTGVVLMCMSNWTCYIGLCVAWNAVVVRRVCVCLAQTTLHTGLWIWRCRFKIPSSLLSPFGMVRTPVVCSTGVRRHVGMVRGHVWCMLCSGGATGMFIVPFWIWSHRFQWFCHKLYLRLNVCWHGSVTMV